MKKGGGATVQVKSNGGGGGNLGPLLAMTLVQFGYAGMNIISKVAMESGMNPFILVAYRQLVATFVIAPFAFFRERTTWPTITRKIIFQIFMCSLFGATGNQLTYFVGLNNSTATISCALTNILPAITFLLAIPFGLETLGIRTKAGLVKIMGTCICIGGAMLLSFYHGHVINVGESKLSWSYADKMSKIQPDSSTGSQGNFFMGPFLLLLSNVSWAVWFIIQARMGEDFDAPYTSSTLMCLMSTLQCTLAAVCIDHTSSSWSLAQPIRLVASIYAGTFGSALGFALMSWTIQKKGPLYVSVFSPLLLVIVAMLSWALLNEKLYVGTAVGSVLVVIGLYAVLWGKNKEIRNKDRPQGEEEFEADCTKKMDDMERQPNVELQLVNEVPGHHE